MNEKPKTILTYGTFDLLHIGHINLFRRARALGDRLVVGVSTDEFNSTKNKRSLIPFEQRIELVRSIRYVDEVFEERSLFDDKAADIRQHNADIVVWGSDWKGQFDGLKQYCEVVYLDRTEGISTTSIKSSLKHLFNIPKDDLLKTLEVLDLLYNQLSDHKDGNHA